MKWTHMPLVVVVWGQQGCPGCSTYIPKFRRVAERYGQCIPSVILSADENAGLADYYRVMATPTTHIFRWGRKSLRWIDGDADEQTIDSLFQFAMRGLDCQIGTH